MTLTGDFTQNPIVSDMAIFRQLHAVFTLEALDAMLGSLSQTHSRHAEQSRIIGTESMKTRFAGLDRHGCSLVVNNPSLRVGTAVALERPLKICGLRAREA